MFQRWQSTPRSVRVAATALVGVLVYGTVVHLVQLVGSGFDPSPDLPGWLRIYLVALTVFDPLAAVLLARRTRTRVALAVAVLVTTPQPTAGRIMPSTPRGCDGRSSRSGRDHGPRDRRLYRRSVPVGGRRTPPASPLADRLWTARPRSEGALSRRGPIAGRRSAVGTTGLQHDRQPLCAGVILRSCST